MIDYTKVNNLPVPAGQILAHELLTFPLSNVATTGEMLNRAQVAHYGSMVFAVRGENVKLKGSYHKHAEDGKNYSDFTFIDIQRVIDELAITFHFDPKKAYYNFIEVGVNLRVSTDPTSLIKNFLLYKQKEFEPLVVFGNGYGRQCRLQQFTTKVYNKSFQYGLPYYLLRFEVKVTRMEFLKKYGINNLSMDDLKRPEVYPCLLKMLLDVFSQILIFNPDLNLDTIQNTKDRDLVLQGKYPEYWKGLPRQRKCDQIKRFTELTGVSQIKKKLAEGIAAKWNELFNADKITVCPDERVLTNPDKLTTLQNEPTVRKNDIPGQNNTTINCYSSTCRITGIDISMQKESSRLLSNKGLLWLVQNDYFKYEEVRYRFLPRRGVSGKHTKFEGNEIKHLAHQLRNEIYNPRRYYALVPLGQLSLFCA